MGLTKDQLEERICTCGSQEEIEIILNACNIDPHVGFAFVEPEAREVLLALDIDDAAMLATMIVLFKGDAWVGDVALFFNQLYAEQRDWANFLNEVDSMDHYTREKLMSSVDGHDRAVNSVNKTSP